MREELELSFNYMVNRGNFSRPMELLKLMPKSPWRKEQEQRFTAASNILENGLELKLSVNQAN